MAKQVVPLSARKVEATKPTDKAQFLFDGGGLFLLIAPQGYDRDGKPLPAVKGWRLKYRFDGKPWQISLGVYPAIGLDEARERRQEAKNQVAKGINPSVERKLKKATDSLSVELRGNTFEKVALQWHAIQEREWSSSHAQKIMDRLVGDVFPLLGGMLISDITVSDVLKVLRLVEDRQAYETAHRVKTIIGQVFRYAKVSSMPGVLSDPTDGLSKVLVHHTSKNRAAILDASEFGRLLRDIDGYAGSFVVKCALKLAPMLFVRPGELRHAKWVSVDFDRAEWRIPAEEMKLLQDEKVRQQGQVHVVPLSLQAMAILRELHLFTGRSLYVFPGRASSRVMSGNTINMALRTMGWDKDTVSGHGFRATARTMLHETLHFSPDAIEAQLGHRVPDRLGAAYNRSKHLDERSRMMQAWADYMDVLKGKPFS